MPITVDEVIDPKKILSTLFFAVQDWPALHDSKAQCRAESKGRRGGGCGKQAAQ